MADRAEKSRRDRREPHPLAVLAGVLAAFLLLAACYVGYQALHILFPQNVYETALPATVSDNVEADGVLLFDEVYVSGSGTLGYLAADGERVSAGTAVAEIYSDASQAVLRQQLTQLTEQIDLLQLQIKDTQDRITENEAQEEQQYQLFCRQVRQEEERGAVSYWSVLFKATGFADLLSRMDFINEIVEHDQSVIDQLRTLREQLAQDKADLEQQQAELTASKTELDAQVAEATRVFEEYAASEAGQQALLNQQAAREKELQEEIRKSEEANRNNQTAVGGFIWPTACRLITGGYGGRDAPCPGASTYHLGVDIGASWGSDIYATKAGTVKVANEGWNYGLGYCVKIQHDDGTSTVYGHMSRVIAVVGQRVAQGQVIGKIGSTGVSTGPHLHYEIRIGGVNGTAVNPLPYLPGYVRYGW